MTEFSKRPQVLASAILVLLLAGSLALRLTAKEPGIVAPGPSSPVLEPFAADITTLEIPCWSCPNIADWPITYKTDLDLLAPLGDGSSNAGSWLVEISRSERIDDVMADRIEGPEDLGQIFPPDHPILDEAGPWTEQAVMKMYPEFYALKGYETEIPNLAFTLSLARSWAHRGRLAADQTQALADFRRAIRLGRLLRQEDVTIIADLVGLVCIKIGAKAIYHQAIAVGDLETALIASIVVGETAPQRMRTLDMISEVDVSETFGDSPNHGQRVAFGKNRLESIIERVGSNVDRRFRAEALLSLHQIAGWADEESAALARDEIDEVQSGDDPFLAVMAAWSIANPVTLDDMAEFFDSHHR